MQSKSVNGINLLTAQIIILMKIVDSNEHYMIPHFLLHII